MDQKRVLMSAQGRERLKVLHEIEGHLKQVEARGAAAAEQVARADSRLE